MQKVLAKIYLKNIRRNAQAFGRLTGRPVCAVVKANAYGHGAEEVVCALEGVVSCFAVSLVSEAIAIRTAACGKDILVLTPPLCEEETLVGARNGFVLTVGDLATARRVAETAEKNRLPVRVHIKTNTGMNRYGTNVQTLGRICTHLKAHPLVRVEGVYSHIYGNTRAQAERQRERFMRMIAVCRDYYPEAIAHLGATYGAILGEKFVFDMTRIGIGLYGYLPDGARDLDEKRVRKLDLKKGMAVYATVAAKRKYVCGGAGYGKDIAKPTGERLITCRFGYADGFLRTKENGTDGSGDNANDLCMDACVRWGNAPKGERVPVMTDAAETAKKAGTISYEVLCAATRRAETEYDYE
ncbi:MAG: alanine racemase [Clostridia bacterium]|nr:alanine racemase [Clostridia bacterium]